MNTASTITINSNPLLRYSLAGQGNALQESAQQQFPLLGKLTLLGQTTVWYGAPNTGKTLLALSLVLAAINDGRIDGHNVIYINADDSASGMAEKATILDDVGAHTLSPGYRGFELSDLAPALEQMAQNGSAKGMLVIIDTLKKIADLMSKKECAEFGKVARNFSLKGGSILGLAHTNKNRGHSGRLVYAGTSDILEDFDCAYMLEERGSEGRADEKFIGATAIKRRGDNAEVACFRFSDEPKISYQQRLLSITAADPEFGNHDEVRNAVEADLIEAIKLSIGNGHNTKMKIAAVAAQATKASRRTVLDVIEKFTGADPAEHLWDYERKERGAHVFFVHPAQEEVALHVSE